MPLRLAYPGGGRPAAVATPLPRVVGLAFAVALLVAVALLFLLFLRREKALGRLAPLTPPEAIDEAWFQEHLFSLRPEEAGGLWDETVGPQEVAAILARLTAEKKIETWAADKTLHMRLIVPSGRTGYEQDLLSAHLLRRSRRPTRTRSATITRARDRSASKIRPELERRLAKIGYGEQAPRASKLPPSSGWVGRPFLLVFSPFSGGNRRLVIGVLILHAAFTNGVSQASGSKKDPQNVLLQTCVFSFVPRSHPSRLSGADEPRPRAELALLAGRLLLLRVGVTNSLFNRRRRGTAR